MQTRRNWLCSNLAEAFCIPGSVEVGGPIQTGACQFVGGERTSLTFLKSFSVVFIPFGSNIRSVVVNCRPGAKDHTKDHAKVSVGILGRCHLMRRDLVCGPFTRWL